MLILPQWANDWQRRQDRRKLLFSRAVRDACRNEAMFDILAQWQCGPLDGGCLVVACALRDVLGGQLAAVWGRHSRNPSVQPTFHHVLLRLGLCYLDADGLSTRGQVIRPWRAVEGIDAPELVDCPSLPDLLAAGIPTTRLSFVGCVSCLSAHWLIDVDQRRQMAERTGTAQGPVAR